MEENKKPDTPEGKSGKKSSRRTGKTSAKTKEKVNTETATTVEVEEAENKVEDVAVEETTEEQVKAAPKKSGRRGANVKALELELEKQKELNAESQDRYKRLLAEFENARQREAQQASHNYDVGAMGILEKLLPVVDNFERAVESIPEDAKEGATEKGVIMIYKQLMKVLEDVGVNPMNATGEEFDPNLHNAVMHIEDENLGENVVAEEMQKGYMYKQQVLRHSMVKVAN